MANDELIYVGKEDQNPLLLVGAISENNVLSGGVSASWKEVTDIAQSHHFTVTLDKIKLSYSSGLGDSDKFLPVQNISFSYTSFGNMSIPVGVFGDLPILRNKSVARISMSLYDNDKDQIEDSIREWEASCFPNGTYVAYLSEIVGELVYRSYDVKGKLNKTLKVSVIPSESYAVNRGYADNAAKTINLSLIALGPITISGGSSSRTF